MSVSSVVRDARIVQLRRRIGRLVTSNYDITDRCNLQCEGCLFFAGDDFRSHADADDIGRWRDFFRSERARGVNFGYFAGAEPSLVPERLRAAHAFIDHGTIFTNGLVRIPDDIRYRIHVSVWGDRQTSRDLRGADCEKALRNYRDDPRVTYVYTITAANIDAIESVVRTIAGQGGRLTFNLFSPTTDYLRAAGDVVPAARPFFRLRETTSDPRLSTDDIARAGAAIERARGAFPQTVIYSAVFHRWLTRPEGIHRIDPMTGIATNCGNRLTPKHRHFNVDLTSMTAKCCSPNLDCSQCRAYAQAYATFLVEHTRSRSAPDATDWVDVWATWARLFLGDDGPNAESAGGGLHGE